jgi:PEP-CTERM motif
MKNTIWSLVAAATLAAMGTTPVYASGGQAWYCSIPIIGRYLCPPAPGGGGGTHSVPEPASLAVLAAGAGLVAAAVRRRRRVQK